MQYLLITLALSASLASVLGAPADASPTKISVVTEVPKIDAEGLAKLAAEVKASAVSTKSTEQIPTSTLLNPAILTPTTYPEKVYIEPPPIFDPPEPRPDTIFDSPSDPSENILRPPPIPLNRMEHMSPFDGAHAHPDDTPYRPDASDVACSFGMQMFKLSAGILGLLAVVYCFVAVGEKILRCFTRVFRRRRSDSGQIRLDETTIEKLAPGYGEGSSLATVLARSRSASKATAA
ncbi:MAG: hypothetical protein MMC23_005469 [Stictis urceolatum]|nr:hypothetical protein [Stictis urceolata]